MTPINRLCLWSLGLLCLCTTPACTPGISKPISSEQQQLTQEKILEELVKANLVYLGEHHNSIADHRASLQIIEALYQKQTKIAIAMEMFQRPFQGVVDEYLAGKITEEQLIAKSEYEQRWGFPWEYYAPIVRFAKEHQLPILALNTPTEVTRKVARQGLASLTEEEQRYIPPLSEIRTDNAQYRQMVREVYQMHPHGEHSNSDGFERFFAAQVLWDETMAEKVAEFYQANPKYKVVVLAGQGHIVYGYGIPSRVARRINNDEFVQRSVILGAIEEQLSPEEQKAIADYIWQQ